MKDLDKILVSISHGKQKGKRYSYIKNGKVFWAAIAIQKWSDIYYVYRYEIAEEKMAVEEFEIDEILKFTHIEDALNYIAKFVDLENLNALKGQKIFDPSDIE